MQLTTRRIIISFLAIFLGLSITACNKTTTTDVTTPNDSIIPQLSNPDGIFMSNDQYTITYADLYQELKVNDGLNQLLMMVDLDLLASYISAVTQDEIDTRLEKLIYSTNDQEEINNHSAQEQADMTKSFYDSMYLLGYDEDSVETYVRVVVARENYAIAEILSDDNSDQGWYAGPTAVADYYASNYSYDVSLIKIRFMSETDAKTVLRLFKLVSMNGELKLYTGTTPLENVPSTSLNDTNTRSLSDAEILQQFILLYNYIYGEYKTPLATDATLEDLLANEDLTVTRDSLVAANTKLDNFVYDTLGTYEDYQSGDNTDLYYTYAPVSYPSANDTSYYMILNLQRTEKVDVADFDGTEADLVALIGQDIYDEMQQAIIDGDLAVSSFVSARIVGLRQEHNLNILDYYLGKDYQSVDADFELDADGSETVVAIYDDKTITADDLFTFAMNLNIPMYLIYASQTPAVIAAHYEDIYCTDETETCEYNVLDNTSEVMQTHLDAYNSLESSFNSSYYASYYTFDEYLYLAYGVRSKYEMIYEYYVTGNLQTYLIYDNVMANNYDILNYLMDLSQAYYDNYFSLNVNHILIYVDRDEDGQPDDYNDFYSSMADTTTYDQMLVDFEAAIRDYLADDTHTMSGLVVDYNKARRDDATWGEFKLFGFNLITEALGEMTYNDSVSVYEESFVDALISLYQDYQANDNQDYLFYDSLVETSYGMHLIEVTKGAAFEKPSAEFTMTYDIGTGEAEFLDALVNSTDELTFDQLKVYADYRFATIAYGTGNLEAIYGLVKPDMPESVLAAINTYFTDLYDGLYVVGYLNYLIIDQLLVSDYVNAVSSYCDMTSALLDEKLAHIQEIYMYQIFEGMDHR
ncbi:MAG: hypothetical protein JXB08_05410 [Bacilli bacterium]|nr:hypothetical protein [Bacilli bacterium]MBN2877579.1 hypothetical protein [Bacilli bacterium]